MVWPGASSAAAYTDAGAFAGADSDAAAPLDGFAAAHADDGAIDDGAATIVVDHDTGLLPEAGADDDRCEVAVYDPLRPPQALSLSGNLGTHDPAIIEQEDVFYLWHTGPRLFGKTSRDLRHWEAAPSALGARNPAWVAREVPGATDLWAPDVSWFGGQYHLYYSASTFGSNTSCIGHATRSSLAAGAWADRGPVICSNHAAPDNFNAIDPNVIVDEAGTAWLVFGSFWDGIKAVELDPAGTRKGTTVYALASRNGGPIEAPFVVHRCSYYYLFVSFDKCCSGVDSTYNIRVGRAKQVLGPYVDRNGRKLLDGGGTPVLQGDGRFRGPGHNAIIFSDDRAFNVYHAYDARAGGNPTLRVAELTWDSEDWPISGGP